MKSTCSIFLKRFGAVSLIGCIVVISTLLGFGYTKLSQPVYRASATYSVNVYSVAGQQICGAQDQMKCLSKQMEQVVSDHLIDGWAASDESVSLSTAIPSPLAAYETQLKESSQQTTAFIKAKALAEIQAIESISNASLLSTERVATNMLNAKRVIQSIDSGQIRHFVWACWNRKGRTPQLANSCPVDCARRHGRLRHRFAARCHSQPRDK